MSEPKADMNSSYPESKAKKNSMYGKIAEQSNQLDSNYCKFGTCPYYDKFCDHTLQDKHTCAYLPHDTAANIKYLEQTFTEFAKTQDELSEEYDAVLKTHGDTLEQHMERIEDLDDILATHAGKINAHTDTLLEHENKLSTLSADVEDLQRKVLAIYKYFNAISPNVFFDICKGIEELAHKGSNFCGNCTHVKSNDGIYTCGLFGGNVDPDSASCSNFEPPF